jgi:flagellar basal-body rod modification protein FlgD
MQTSLFSTPSSTANTTSGLAKATTAESADLFTKLLVAQIKNQDPMSPTDPSAFVNQLTQLSQMESMQQLVSQTTNNNSLLQSMQMMALGAQVGSNITATTDHVVLGTDQVKGSFTLANTNSAVNVVLTGVDGTEHRIPLGSQGTGDVSFSIDPASLGLAAGSYGIAVETSSKETPSVGITGAISSLKLGSSGSAVLTVANLGEIQPSAITQFNGR